MKAKDLPEDLPIFPLHGVMLLPRGRMPLNVFEPRYIAMCDEALRSHRMIGMIQPRKHKGHDLYSVGCAGKIVEFTETEDGRYEIVLSGLTRFTYTQELPEQNGFRRIKPDWQSYAGDLESEHKCLGLQRDRLKELLQIYFKREGMECCWSAFDGAPDGKLMTCLAMACPLEPAEKQALLEEKCCKKRASMFMTLLEMEVYKAPPPSADKEKTNHGTT